MRRLFLLLCALMLCLPLITGVADESMEEKVSGDYRYYVTKDNTAVITYCSSDAAEVVIPAELDGHPVDRIASNAFESRNDMRILTVPEGVRVLDSCAFQSCDGLEEVSLPESLRELREGAFWGCDALRRINIPDGLTYVGEGIFAYARPEEIVLSENHPLLRKEGDALVRKEDRCLIWYPPQNSGSYRVPEDILRIGRGAFCRCELEEIILPEGLQSLSQIAITSCNQISEIRIPKGIQEMVGTINTCKGLKNIEVDPENEWLTSVDGVVFSKDRTTLVCYPAGRKEKNYNVPAGTRVIGSQAVSGAEGLKTVKLPDGVEVIEDNAFSICYDLEKINFPEGLKKIGHAAFQNSKLTEISLPSTLEELHGLPFIACMKLKKIKVAKGNAFYEAKDNMLIYKPEKKLVMYPPALNPKKITIPKDVEVIASFTFASCSKLSEVTVPEGVRIIMGSSFSDCYALKKVMLPKSIEIIDFRAFETFSPTYSAFGNATFYVYVDTKAEEIIRSWGAPMQIRK